MVEVKKTSKKAKKVTAKKMEEPVVIENKEETADEPVLGESKVEESDGEAIKETIDEAIKEDLNKIAENIVEENKKDEVAVKTEPIVEHETENKPSNKSKIIRNFTATWNGVTMDY